ncbi:MAG: YdeI/OmpD-associated family protein [Puniceicoccales bacterium]|nr:YdeI/OmpD-associated family protein [Puniceicoccales bacterium]
MDGVGEENFLGNAKQRKAGVLGAGEKFFRMETQEEWRRWLEENGQKSPAVWLLFPRKDSGHQGISYYQALEEALCFGWIDGMVRRYDQETISNRFSRRTAKSSWSEVNKQHARLLIERGKMTPAGAAVLPDLDPNSYAPPEDILEKLRQDSQVWENFCAFPTYYRNIRLAAIDLWRKNPDRFRRSLDTFIVRTRANRRYGRFR